MERTSEIPNRTPHEPLTSGSTFKTLETNYERTPHMTRQRHQTFFQRDAVEEIPEHDSLRSREAISSCLGGTLKKYKEHRVGRFVPQPQWHSNKTSSKPINDRCGMQRKTNTKTWNGFCAAASCFEGKTLQRFRLFLPSMFQPPSWKCRRHGGTGDIHRNEEQERAAANLFDCPPYPQEVSNGPCGSQGQRSETPGVSLNNHEGP